MNGRILVVDDESNIRMMIRLALQHVGHTVETAADGPDGLGKFGDGAGWDLVLLDQRMPGMAGLDVLREMRQRRPDARVIMITAFGTIDLAVDAMKAGATDFLRKPFTPDTLRNAVQMALAGTQPREVGDEEIRLLFSRAAINGYRIEFVPEPGQQTDGELRHTFTVYGPGEGTHTCTVVLPAYVMELVKAHADREEMPAGFRFWQALCEEALANYLWQYADYPPGDLLRVDEFTTGLKHWVDASLQAAET